MLEKIERIVKVEVDAAKAVFVEKVIEIVEDGVVLNSTIHRSSFEPYEPLTKLPEEARVIASAVWTEEVVAEAIAKKSSGPSNRIGV